MQRRPFLGSAPGLRRRRRCRSHRVGGRPARRPPVALADWGSFHVGGREVVVSGQPAREVLFSPGGVPLGMDLPGLHPDFAFTRLPGTTEAIEFAL